MTDNQMRRKLIAAGVKNLITFGYPNADEQNILTDPIYKAFFVKMLEDDENAAITNNQFQKVRTQLLSELNN